MTSDGERTSGPGRHNPGWPLFSDNEWYTGRSDGGIRSPEQQAAIDALTKPDDDDSSVGEDTMPNTGKIHIDSADLWKYLRPRLGMSIDGGKTWYSMPMVTEGAGMVVGQPAVAERPDPTQFDPLQGNPDWDRDFNLHALVRLDRNQGPAILKIEADPQADPETIEIGSLPGPTFITLPDGHRLEVFGLLGTPGEHPPTTQVWANDLDSLRIPTRRPKVRLTLVFECDDFIIADLAPEDR